MYQKIDIACYLNTLIELPRKTCLLLFFDTTTFIYYCTILYSYLEFTLLFLIFKTYIFYFWQEDTDDEDADPLRIDESMIGPEVSLIPIRKTKLKPTISVKSREKLIDVNVLQKPGPVQIITPEIGLTEEEHTQYARRRSQPLEKCPICKQFFRRLKTHLQKHTEITPEEEAILICQYCKKKFNTGSNLSVHMRTHTGDRPYICTVCTAFVFLYVVISKVCFFRFAIRVLLSLVTWWTIWESTRESALISVPTATRPLRNRGT